MFVKIFVLFLCFNFVLPQGQGSGANGNLRLCVVEGRGAYKRASRFCPILDDEKSGVECVIGTDRLDCLRRMSKGTVDAGVFSPEDLVAAQWAHLDVLVTNELRSRPRPYASSVVAVVNRAILPDSSTTVQAVLKNTSLCHPGLGADDTRPLSDTLTEYLESLVTVRSCDPSLSLAENRIRALSQFFSKACKAGPWVNDRTRDADLKFQYKSLCSACGSPRCARGDRYWGAAGALACLAEGAGDVTWAEADDVASYFGLIPGTTQYASPDSFAYLCRDGTWQGLRGAPEPCAWLHRPWPVLVAKRKASAAVSKLASTLTNSSVTVDPHWHGALTALLESNQALPEPLRPEQTPEDYLARARGFREAYSQAGCSPSRHITLCTTSPIERNKCEWLSEAGAVYGIEPPLQCAVTDDKMAAMTAVKNGDCDAVVADGDWLVKAMRDLSLTPILHETTPFAKKTSTVIAYVRKDSDISKMADLRHKMAAFPRFDGFAWHSVLRYISKKEKSTCMDVLNNYFKSACAPGVEDLDLSTDLKKKWTENCYFEGGKALEGELMALRSLVEGKSDVAFLNMDTYNQYAAKQIQEPWIKDVEIVPVCPEENQKYCFTAWSSIGHIFTKNVTEMRHQEIINVFTKLDQLFGANYPFHSAMFSMYGPFNHKYDVLFHNNTRSLSTDNILRMHPYDKIPLNFERSLDKVTVDSCHVSDLRGYAVKSAPTILVFILVACVFLS